MKDSKYDSPLALFESISLRPMITFNNNFHLFSGKDSTKKLENDTVYRTVVKVSVQGVESLLGDCRFIPADWGSQ